jgi:hypothetical protein
MYQQFYVMLAVPEWSVDHEILLDDIYERRKVLSDQQMIVVIQNKHRYKICKETIELMLV